MRIKKVSTTKPMQGYISDTENVDDKTTNAPSLRLADEMINEKGVIVSSTEPITGEKVWIQKGKNLFDGIEVGAINANGILETSNTRLRSKNAISINPSTEYTAKVVECNSSKGDAKINVIFYDEDNNFISTSGWQDETYTFTTPSNCKYVRLLFYLSNSTTQTLDISDITKVQLEQNPTATEYEEYIEPKIYVKNDNGVYEEFIKREEEIYSLEERRIGTWIDGKPLYRKTVSCGALPNATTKSISIGTSDIKQVTDIHGFASNITHGATMPIPYTHISDITKQVIVSYSGGPSGVIYIETGTDRSSFSGYIVVEYTKTTD